LTCFDACRIQTLFKSYKQDNLIFTRGVKAFLSGIPAATSIESIPRGFNTIGMKQQASDVTIFDRLMDSNPLFLIGNTDTVVVYYTSTSWTGMAQEQPLTFHQSVAREWWTPSGSALW